MRGAVTVLALAAPVVLYNTLYCLAAQHRACCLSLACVVTQGAVTVFALAVPSVFSLLVLLRNEAARGIESTKLEWVRARVKEQCELLEAGQPLTFPLDALLVCAYPFHSIVVAL